MKKIHFLTALPRSGTTLLGSLINGNNKKLAVSPHSLLLDILYRTNELKKTDIFLNFPDHISLDNFLSKSLSLYYEKVEHDIILDKGTWGTPYNLELIQKLIQERKFVVLTRKPIECLASFMRLLPGDIENMSDFFMSDDGPIGKNIWSIRNLIKQKEKYIHIEYEDLVKTPQKTINKICDFLKVEKFKIKLNAFSFNCQSYDDSVLSAPIHEVRLDKIKKLNYEVEDILPKNTIKKYKNFVI
jgi:sulfotransferase